MKMWKILMAAMALCLAVAARAEDSTAVSRQKVHRLEIEAVPGLILHTNDFLRGNNSEVRTMNHAFTAKVKYAFAPPPGSMEAARYKGVYQGVGLAWHDLNPQLGHPLSLFLFQGATIKTLAPRLSLDYEWNLGLAYGWKKYDAVSNPDNRVIGSKMTAHISVDFYLRYRLSKQWDLNLGASVTHYSNGNTSIPNAGLNIAGLKVGAAYYFRERGRVGASRSEECGGISRSEECGVRSEITSSAECAGDTLSADYSHSTLHTPHSSKQSPPSSKRWTWDLTLYGAWKRKGLETEAGSYAIPGKYGVVGVNVNPLYRINRWLNVGPSLDASYDASANLEFDTPTGDKFQQPTEVDVRMAPWYRRVALGLSGRVEFTMPYFTINFGIGHNIVNAQTDDLEGFYEILALKVHILRKTYVHIGYSLYDFYYPNNLMLGLGVHL